MPLLSFAIYFMSYLCSAGRDQGGVFSTVLVFMCLPCAASGDSHVFATRFPNTIRNHSNAVDRPGEAHKDVAEATQRVTVGGSKAGVIRYLGATQFALGEWVGVELDEPCKII